MKKEDRIKRNIEKATSKKSLKFEKSNYFPEEELIKNFISDAKNYIKAIKERRMFCVIHSVSKSGMTRTISFHSCEKSGNKKQYCYRQYYCFFKALGYSKVRDSYFFRIHGCGMDMIFHTNYTIIHYLESLGFINKKQCEKLAQMTPTCY